MSDEPAYEFTYQGMLFKVFEDGHFEQGISPFADRNVRMVINRIPALITRAVIKARDEEQAKHYD